MYTGSSFCLLIYKTACTQTMCILEGSYAVIDDISYSRMHIADYLSQSNYFYIFFFLKLLSS